MPLCIKNAYKFKNKKKLCGLSHKTASNNNEHNIIPLMKLIHLKRWRRSLKFSQRTTPNVQPWTATTKNTSEKNMWKVLVRNFKYIVSTLQKIYRKKNNMRARTKQTHQKKQKKRAYFRLSCEFHSALFCIGWMTLIHRILPEKNAVLLFRIQRIIYDTKCAHNACIKWSNQVENKTRKIRFVFSLASSFLHEFRFIAIFQMLRTSNPANI